MLTSIRVARATTPRKGRTVSRAPPAEAAGIWLGDRRCGAARSVRLSTNDYGLFLFFPAVGSPVGRARRPVSRSVWARVYGFPWEGGDRPWSREIGRSDIREMIVDGCGWTASFAAKDREAGDAEKSARSSEEAWRLQDRPAREGHGRHWPGKDGRIHHGLLVGGQKARGFFIRGLRIAPCSFGPQTPQQAPIPPLPRGTLPAILGTAGSRAVHSTGARPSRCHRWTAGAERPRAPHRESEADLLSGDQGGECANVERDTTGRGASGSSVRARIAGVVVEGRTVWVFRIFHRIERAGEADSRRAIR